MPNPHEPEVLRYEDRLRAREMASRRAWNDEQRRRVVDAGARARAQRRHDWREADPSASAEPPAEGRSSRTPSASTLLMIEVVGASLGALHLAVASLGVTVVWGAALPAAVALGAIAAALTSAGVVAYAAWPAERRVRGGLGRPVERLLVGVVGGAAAGWLVLAAWLLSTSP